MLGNVVTLDNVGNIWQRLVTVTGQNHNYHSMEMLEFYVSKSISNSESVLNFKSNCKSNCNFNLVNWNSRNWLLNWTIPFLAITVTMNVTVNVPVTVNVTATLTVIASVHDHYMIVYWSFYGINLPFIRIIAGNLQNIPPRIF
jgi:hypothetical protein